MRRPRRAVRAIHTPRGRFPRERHDPKNKASRYGCTGRFAASQKRREFHLPPSDVSLREHRQEKRWSRIQANGPESVKGAHADPLADIRAQVAFPILAIAPSVRHTGIVCLDGRLRTIVARSHRARDHTTDHAVVQGALAELEYEIERRAPGTVIIERDFEPRHAAVTDVLADRLAERARESGARVIRLSCSIACSRFADTGDARDAAVVLLRRYEALRKRLAPAGTPLLRHERWREAKPLMSALALAHSVALAVLTASARPLGTGPPPLSL